MKYTAIFQQFFFQLVGNSFIIASAVALWYNPATAYRVQRMNVIRLTIIRLTLRILYLKRAMPETHYKHSKMKPTDSDDVDDYWQRPTEHIRL